MLVLLIVCGLPAAGKSSLCARLSAWLKEKERGRWRVDWIEFDALLNNSSSNSERERVLVNLARNFNFDFNDEDDARILLIDDNMHRRSQRKQCVRTVCQRLDGSGCVSAIYVHVQVDLKIAVERDLKRRDSVGVDVIERMHSSFDSLSSSANAPVFVWLNNDVVADDDSRFDELHELILDQVRAQRHRVEGGSQAASSNCVGESEAHRFDVESRRLLAAMVNGVEAPRRASVARELNALRRCHLKGSGDNIESFVHEAQSILNNKQRCGGF
jgi:tRNA uridine 5-carbamoylmethylation protein Kti12